MCRIDDRLNRVVMAEWLRWWTRNSLGFSSSAFNGAILCCNICATSISEWRDIYRMLANVCFKTPICCIRTKRAFDSRRNWADMGKEHRRMTSAEKWTAFVSTTRGQYHVKEAGSKNYWVDMCRIYGKLHHVVMAEWLRRWTWNPLGCPRAGSNPADYVFFI